jgi:hypothetical protein
MNLTDYFVLAPTSPRNVAALLALVAGLAAGLAGANAAEQSKKAAAQPPGKTAKAPAPKPEAKEITLFDGKTLKGWRETDFAGRGKVTIEDGKLLLGMGYMTGITWTSDIPRMNYELSLDAMRTEGSDFFCGLTFPVASNQCSLVVGGWGGSLVGLSSLDGEDAANNETSKSMTFTNKCWYQIRLRVEPEKIQAWIDDEKLVDVVTKERRVSIRLEMESSVPLGVATWSTGAAIRNFKLQRL